MTGPLSGLRVLELGGVGPVAFAGTALADLGADVVRIGRPGTVRAINVMLRDRPMDAAWLESVGLADAVVPDGEALAAAMELATQLGPATPPLALVGLRELMASASANSLDEQLAAEAGWVRRLGRSDGFEGVSAFLQRRAPQFRGR